MADPRTPADTPLERIRALLGEYESKRRTLPALLGDLKHEVAELDDGDPLRRRLVSGLRALGRAWSDAGEQLHSTLTVDGEHRLREAIEDLKKALDAG